MYDTLNLRLYADDVGNNVSLVEEIPTYLDQITGEHNYAGYVIVTGKLGTLDVSVSRLRVKVFNNSFAKYYFSDPYSVMGRKDMQGCLEKLSDELHLNMGKAEVCRLDFGQNFVMKADTNIYLQHLGELKRPTATRLPQSDGLYYSGRNTQLAFYNKNREQSRQGNPIPELYKGRQVLRYEYRFLHRLPEELGVARVTANMLYEENFYMRLIDTWKKSFEAIQKINDINLNFDMIRTKKELYRLSLLHLIEQRGGQMAFTNSVVEAAKKGKITAKQKHDLLGAIEDACKVDDSGLVVENETIKELEDKIKQATKFYR